MATYNGVNLPTLPAHSTSSYTKACIVHNTVTDEYALILATTANTITYSNTTYTQDTGVILIGPSSSFSEFSTIKSYKSVDGTWTISDVADLNDDYRKYIIRPDTITPVWSNFDIPKSDGTVLLAASEPIYPKTVQLKWAGLKNWVVGVVLGMTDDNAFMTTEEG